MSERWHKDSKTGEYYQEWREKGKTVRSYRVDRQSSSNRAEPSSSRRDQPPPQSRRDSIISVGSIDAKSASRYQTQRGTSSKRETSGRPDDDRQRDERGETRYTTDTRGYGGQDEIPAGYEDQHEFSSYRGGDKIYHPAGGYNPPQTYAAANIRDPADSLVGGVHSLSMGTDYTHEPIASSLPAPGVYADTAYGTHDSTSEDYGQTSTAQSALSSRETVPASRQVKGTFGDSEKLDKSYQVRNHDYKKFFRVGRVFATLWTEGVGHNFYDKDQTFVSAVVYNERVHSKIRRFVIVREGDRSVTCLPVTSYDGDGHKKRGIRLKDHGFIHSKTPPKKVDGMLSRSLKVVLSKGAAHIKDPSLVNYGKVYTVETNVKVKDIGELDKDTKSILAHYFRQVFVGESTLPSGVDITPRQSNAVLAHVGGATSNFASTSGYNENPLPTYPTANHYYPSTGQDMTSGYPPSTYATQDYTGHFNPPVFDTSVYRYPAGYNASSDMQPPRAGGEPQYTSQAGTGYPAASMNYGSMPSTSPGFNTTPNYYRSASTHLPSDPGYSSAIGGPTSGVPYSGESYSVSYTPRTYPSEQLPSDHAPVIDDRDDDIKLPTLEEASAGRRRESDAKAPRDRRRRR